jgi:uncharacterized protein (DUF1330 family)
MRTSYKIGAVAIFSAGLGAVAMQGLHAQAKPPAFLIFDVQIKDQAGYEPFRQTAARELQAQGGKYLVQGAVPEVLVGDPPNRITISQWASKDDALRWFNSEAMKPVKEAQTKYTNTRRYVVEGRAQ